MKAILLFISFLLIPALGFAQRVEYTPADSALVVRLLAEAKAQRGDEHPMLWFGKKFIGVPYVAHTLEGGDSEHLVVNLHELDCTTFVETVAALSLCDADDARTFADYCRNLTRIRYRQGRIADYTSRLHYFTWWADDNERMGIVKEVVPTSDNADSNGRHAQAGDGAWTAVQTINIDYMTTHPDSYRQLKAHPEFIPAIRQYEQESKGKRFRYIPKQNTGWSSRSSLNKVHTGDILAMLTSKPGLDTSHIGIAVWQGGRLHLLNASSLHKKVVLEVKTLHDYQQSQRSQTGIRVFRFTPFHTPKKQAVFTPK